MAVLGKANLADAILINADLINADLRGANLFGADLLNANLRGANLFNADLGGANLLGASLLDADLREANLLNAYLRGANLLNADLRGANLRGAILINANLRGTNLLNADLRGADLLGADFRYSILDSAQLSGARNIPAYVDAVTRILPEEGEIIGWKKCSADRIVKLLVPSDARRTNGTGRKCRAEKALVLEITDRNGAPLDEAVSQYDPKVVYRVGETVVPCNGFNEDRWTECGGGIHFYITREEALYD